MAFRTAPFLCATAVSLTACAGGRSASQPDSGRDRQTVETVRSLLRVQTAAWNAGSIEGFMAGYWRSDSLRFASGGTVTYGYDATLVRYRRAYPDRRAMGTLTFSDLTVTPLGADAALAFGRWGLETADGRPGGLFTLLLRRTPDGWRIVADHTSSAP